MTEIVKTRTLTSKTFDLGSGRRRLTTAIGPVHYRVDPLDVKEPWKDIDRTLVSDVAGIRCLSNTYQVQIVEKNLDLGVRALAEFAYRGKKMTIAPVALEYRNAAGAAQTLSTGADVKPVVSGNSVTWPDVFGKGIDFGYTVSHLGFQKVVTIHQTESLPTPKIDSKGLRLCAVLSMAWDSTANARRRVQASRQREFPQIFRDRKFRLLPPLPRTHRHWRGNTGSSTRRGRGKRAGRRLRPVSTS